MSAALKLTIDPEGIARVVFDYPGEKINKISMSVLEDLDSLLDGIADNTHIKALVFTSGKKDVFIAGVDLKNFEAFLQEPALARSMLEMGHSVFNKLSNLPFPTIAAVHGACLGGGLELSLACTYRVVSDHPKTQLGLPETSLGIFPGWGGTQRLPRLVGLTQGLTMILSGKSIPAIKAWKTKLADAILPWEFFEPKLEEFIHDCLTEPGKRRLLDSRKCTGLFPLLFEKNPIGRSIVFWQSKKNVLKQTKGHYPAPIAALKVVQKTYGKSLCEGLKIERETFLQCMKSDFKCAKYLIGLFFASEAMKKDPGLPEGQQAALPIHAVGVLGAGVMGAGISWLMSYRDIPVRMKDINWEAVGRGYAASWDTYKTLMKIRKLTPLQANRKFLQLAGAVDFSGFEHVDLVVEAAVEDLDLKHKILAELEEHIRPNTIVATNSSSLTLKEMSTAMKHPERLVGMHFFNPPSRMPLVEVVRGEKTLPEVIVTAVELCKRLKKTPIVVRDCSGFLVNRIFARGFVEVLRMFEEGVEMERLDKALLKFGMPMGPFVVTDYIGNDVNYKAFHNFEKAYGDRMKLPAILASMNERRWLGKKTGKGFYLYSKKNMVPNPEIQALIHHSAEKSRLSDEGIVEGVNLAMVNEAALCLEEGIVANPEYLDVAMVFGIGFPPFRGGVLHYADSLGIKTVVSKLKALQQTVGDRYAPTKLLLEMEKSNKDFF